MTLALRYSVRSDVGLLREGNEDSAYAGPHLLAVADGMGGHAAGEVASAATITTIAPLDVEDPGPDLVGALADAVATANLRLQELIISDPAIEGMGTTLTALLWSDGYAALCHIGDSRAYLLRDGQFVQITHDHTLVQSLVDEGKITEDDVATHPHRSLLLRALDGRTIAEPDLAPLETYPGDRYLLCSDGLSGVVTEQTLHQTLGSIPDPDKAALRLVELAIKGGGPDNITCIVADVIDPHSSRVAATWQPVFAGAAANGAPGAAPQPTAQQNSPATRAMRLSRTAPQPVVPSEPATGVWQAGGYNNGYTGAFDTSPFEAGGVDRGEWRPDGGSRPDRDNGMRDTASFERADGFPGPDDDRDEVQAGIRGRRPGGHRAVRRRYDDDDDYGHRRRRWPIVTTALVLLVLLVGGGLYGFWRYNQGQYYVGVQDGFVSIFRGTNQSVAGISLSSLVQRSTLPVSQLRTSDQDGLAQTISTDNLNDAHTLLDQLQGQVSQCTQEWQAVAAWPADNARYQAEVAAAAKSKGKIKVPAGDNPGPQPNAPDAANCASATALGVTIPPSQPPAAASSPAASSPKARTTPTSSAKSSPTPQAAA
jgi:PPM family protein phosphatase